MNQARPRATKLSEFAAHGSPINCLHVGRKSNGVLATGGEDHTVKLWAIGNAHHVMSLSGHTSPVQTVCFDHAEELVVAGSFKGDVKVYDLSVGRVLRSWTAHRSCCTAAEWSPVAPKILVTGSQDTNIKVWDLRSPSDAVQVMRGHNGTIRRLAISPNGQLIGSGSDDGDVRVWEGRGAKEHYRYSHGSSVTGLQFHPVEYAMVSSSMDKTIKFVDLDRQDLVTSQPEATGVRAITFDSSGEHLFSATGDTLKVWQSDPLDLRDVVDARWASLGDLVHLRDKNKLLGCSFNSCIVGLWSVDLNKAKPWRPQQAEQLPDTVTLRQGRLTGDSGRSISGDALPSAGLVTRSPGNRRSGASSSVAAPAAPTMPALSSPAAAAVAAACQQEPALACEPVLAQQVQPRQADRPRLVSAATNVGESLAAAGQLLAGSPAALLGEVGQKHAGRLAGSSRRSTEPEIEIRIPAARHPVAGTAAAAAAADAEAFSPSYAGRGLAAATPNAAPSTSGSLSDQGLLSLVMQGHHAMVQTIDVRARALERLQGLLARGDVRGACSAAQVAADVATDEELVRRLRDMLMQIKMELVPALLQPLERVLLQGSSRQQMHALQLLELLLNAFGDRIRETCEQEVGRGVDLSFEERRQRCEAAKLALQGLGMRLALVARRGGVEGLKAKALSAQVQAL